MTGTETLLVVIAGAFGAYGWRAGKALRASRNDLAKLRAEVYWHGGVLRDFDGLNFNDAARQHILDGTSPTNASV